MKWEYGMVMAEECGIDLNTWSDDKEEVFSCMDRKFDYLWDILPNGKLRFVDRCYHDSICDEEVRARIARNEADMVFDDYDQVRDWIKRRK